MKTYKADVTIIGGGLAGLTAAADLLDAGKSITLLERDLPENFGGLATRSFGGITFADTPEQRKLGIHDSPELVFQDWTRYGEMDPDDAEDLRIQWVKSYAENCMPLIYDWLHAKKIKFLPLVNWPERGMFVRGNSIPRWHITWGTGKEITSKIGTYIAEHKNRDKLRIHYGHNVQNLVTAGKEAKACTGTTGEGEEFKAESECWILACGGICGGDLNVVKQHWDKDFSAPPDNLLNGSHRYADGQLHFEAEKKGAILKDLQNQWHYAAGIDHPNPKFPGHGLSLVPPRSGLWLNALGERFGQLPLTGYTDTSYLVHEIAHQPGQYSWLVFNWKIAIKELAVSGGEYMTAFRDKKKLTMILNLLFGNKKLVRRLISESDDVISATNVNELAEQIRQRSELDISIKKIRQSIADFDKLVELGERFTTDFQLMAIHSHRMYIADKLRVCKSQTIADPKAGPLIAIKLKIISRKSLGGIETDLTSRVTTIDGLSFNNLYAVGETAGFGGGGIHGKRALEGTFLGSCVLTGRVAAKSIVNG